jgi:hypothetical protein
VPDDAVVHLLVDESPEDGVSPVPAAAPSLAAGVPGEESRDAAEVCGARDADSDTSSRKRWSAKTGHLRS